MYLRSLSVRSLRCFQSASLDLRYPLERRDAPLRYPNVNILLGNNGAGKTTLLKACALASLAPLFTMGNTGLLPYRLIRNKARSASIEGDVELHASNQETRSKENRSLRWGLTIARTGDGEMLKPLSRRSFASLVSMFSDRSPAFLVVGYGATRRVEDASSFSLNEQLKRRALRYQRVAGLFEPHISLIPLGTWLPEMRFSNPGRHKQVISLLQRLLPSDAAFEGEQEGDASREYLFKIRGVEAPFSALSDGYRAYIGWVSDLLYHVCMGAPSGARLDENRGIVLVDEIDLHLHPAWQRSVISRLSEALPQLQFVFTTHSPIVASSVERHNLFVMSEGPRGSSRVEQLGERSFGLDAQQILLSPYFGLDSTRAIGFIDEMDQLSRKLKPGKPEIALQMMRRLAGREDS